MQQLCGPIVRELFTEEHLKKHNVENKNEIELTLVDLQWVQVNINLFLIFFRFWRRVGPLHFLDLCENVSICNVFIMV